MSNEMEKEVIFKKGNLEGNFGVQIDTPNSRVCLHFEGYFGPESAEKFFMEYNKAKTSVDLKKTSLYIDTKGMKPFPQDSLDSAGEVYKDYLNFKDVTMLEPDNVIAKMQIHRVLKSNGIEDKYKFITK